MNTKLYIGDKSLVASPSVAPSASNARSPLVSKKVLAFGAASTALSSAPAFADGANVGTLANSWNTYFPSVGKVVIDGFTIIGVGIAGSGLLELKRSQEPNGAQQNSAKSAGTKILVGGGLAGISQIVNLGLGTIFNGSGNSTVSQGTIGFS